MKMRPRKKLFIDVPVQGALLRLLISHWAIAVAVMFAYLVCMEVITSEVPRPLTEHIASTASRYSSLLLVLVTVFPVFVVDSIRLSHRFVGPMVSFRRALEKLARGESISELNFRRTDHWKQLAIDLNKIAKRLEMAAEMREEQTSSV